MQSLLSLLLYLSHLDKQVGKYKIKRIIYCVRRAVRIFLSVERTGLLYVSMVHVVVIFSAFSLCMQVYSRLNHVGVCMSYGATLRLVDPESLELQYC